MGRIDNAYDNAMMEALWSRMPTEMLNRRPKPARCARLQLRPDLPRHAPRDRRMPARREAGLADPGARR
jgi:hypothetical protein